MNSAQLRKSNIFKVLSCLKAGGHMAKPEISLQVGLTNASVHGIVNELLSKGIILEDGVGASTGGRKASIYRFNPSHRLILAVYIALTTTTLTVYDLDFQPLISRTRQLDLNQMDVQTSIATILSEIHAIIAQSQAPKSSFAGIGICVPGPVNRDAGVISRLFNAKKWVNIPIRQAVEQSTGLHTVVDKDNNGAVLHYKWTAPNNRATNVVNISITDGIGSGILLHGALFRGSHQVAGEVGHICVNPGGSICNCGNHGCLELYASNSGIVHRATEQINAGRASVLKEALDKRDLVIMDVAQAAKAFDALACELFVRAADSLVISLDNIIKIYDPDEIVFDGEWLGQLPDIFSMICNRVFENNPIIDRSNLRLQLLDDEDILIKGAATLVYDEIFSSVETCSLI